MSDVQISLAMLEIARETVKPRLDEYGYLHSENVSALAGMLASLYGVNVLEAQLAGLLHDWDRCITHEELIEKAHLYGIALDPVTLRHPRLLHAHTGAHDARATLLQGSPAVDIGHAVEQAIANHTVGSPEMADLDKIVYVADMLEPSREFPQIDILREMMGTVALDDLFRQCYARTLTFLAQKRRAIHPDTLAVWNTLVADADASAEAPFTLKGIR